ncbi:MAG: hypothetical protein SGJ18_14015 [Pseudomonadota bacterium]|nr:hypothetical protein [Pseudomonadota bacterium]
MKKRFFIVLAILSLTTTVTFACGTPGKSGFAPENNLKISQWGIGNNGMTEERFRAIIKNIFDIYTPVVAAKDALLVVYGHWDDDTVNANANTWGKRWVINMYGGLARHPLATEDGFALVFCHELGHFLGGAPRKDRPSWASNEGQSDYFGSMKCLKRVFEKEDNIAVVSKMNIDPQSTKQCELVYRDAREVALCQRISMAGKSLGRVLGDIHGNSNVNFSTPDTSTVGKTYGEHPAPQCRLDTYFNGTLCDRSYDQDTDPLDPKIGVCTTRDGYKVGTRPLCWYKPTSSEI